MNVKSLFSCLAGVAAVSALAVSTPAAAADYPTKQIEIIVPAAAGGGTDLLTRAFADAGSKHFSQALGVVNKPGGGCAIGLTEIAMARPDGYKIGTAVVELVTLPPLGMVAFKPSDVKPIAMLNAEPAAITVKADAPWNTIQEFLDYAKANPGQVRVGNSGTGAIWHLAAAALGMETGVEFNHIPYDGGAAPAITALLGGHIEAVAVSPGEVINHVQGGTLKTLVVMSDERMSFLPDVPTLKESGVDLSIGTWRGIVVPKKTPDNVVDYLNDAVGKTAHDPAFQELLKRANITYAYADGPAFEKLITDQAAYFDKLIDSLNLKQN